jgi:YceI-like domain
MREYCAAPSNRDTSRNQGRHHDHTGCRDPRLASGHLGPRSRPLAHRFRGPPPDGGQGARALRKFQGQIVTVEDLLQSSATATVNLNSVNTGSKTRDDDLRSGNFFDADTHPAMTYRSTGIRRAGEDFVIEQSSMAS